MFMKTVKQEKSKIVTKGSYKPLVTNPQAKRTKPVLKPTQPNMALSIRKILERFTRNQATDVKVHEGTYSDQEDFDLEKVSRMSFDEKRELARELRRKAEGIAQGMEEAKEERKRIAKQEADAKKQAESKAAGGQPEAKA